MNQDELTLADFLPVLMLMLRPAQIISSPPTAAPRNFAESIKFYKNGTTYRIYFYVVDAWKYATLT